jgi:hypothetical protein
MESNNRSSHYATKDQKKAVSDEVKGKNGDSAEKGPLERSTVRTRATKNHEQTLDVHRCEAAKVEGTKDNTMATSAF